MQGVGEKLSLDRSPHGVRDTHRQNNTSPLWTQPGAVSPQLASSHRWPWGPGENFEASSLLKPSGEREDKQQQCQGPPRPSQPRLAEDKEWGRCVCQRQVPQTHITTGK